MHFSFPNTEMKPATYFSQAILMRMLTQKGLWKFSVTFSTTMNTTNHYIFKAFYKIKKNLALAKVALFCKLKGLRFESQSGHMPGLWVWSLVRHV